MLVEHSTVLPHDPAEVHTWRGRRGAWTRLLPPGVAQVDQDAAMAPGSTTRLRLGSAMLPAGARPQIELQTTTLGPELGWTEQQRRGPFTRLEHRHRLTAEDDPHGAATRYDQRVDFAWAGPGEGLAARQLARNLDFAARQLRDDLAFHRQGPQGRRWVVAVAGASGLIGTQVCALLESAGHEVRRMVRRAATGPEEISWDPDAGRLEAGSLAGVDAVINLAGRSIGTRFTPRAKQEILSSRVRCSELISRTLATMSDGPRVLVQASAIGYYGAQRPGELLGEGAGAGDDFLAEVVTAWEGATRRARDHGVRTVHLRTGIVLSDGGGALPPQLPAFLLGLGGRLASARSMISWISLDDMARAYLHAVGAEALEGPVNAVAPAPVSAEHFAHTLGRVLHRPAAVPVPSFAPALLLGGEAARELIQADQDVDPARLVASGFVPAHPDLETALRHVLRR